MQGKFIMVKETIVIALSGGVYCSLISFVLYSSTTKQNKCSYHVSRFGDPSDSSVRNVPGDLLGAITSLMPAKSSFKSHLPVNTKSWPTC
jgi:hypothetical protein